MWTISFRWKSGCWQFRSLISMRTSFVAVLLSSVAFASIAGAETHPSFTQGSKTPPPRASQEGYSRIETVAYMWESNRIAVVFRRDGYASSWTAIVRDSWDVYEQAKSETKIWDVSSSRCSMDEWLVILDRSLRAFHSDRPEAKLSSLDLEMQLIRPVWADILAALKRKLSTMESLKAPGAFEVPVEIGEEIQHLLDSSPTTAVITKSLEKHPLRLKRLSWSQIVMFKSSVSGRKWSEIAGLQGLAIMSPGIIEWEFESQE